MTILHERITREYEEEFPVRDKTINTMTASKFKANSASLVHHSTYVTPHKLHLAPKGVVSILLLIMLASDISQAARRRMLVANLASMTSLDAHSQSDQQATPMTPQLPNINNADNSNNNPKQESRQAPAMQPLCSLGNDTYQLGERWNPNLPPFGVQVCVQCECVVRQKKSCYEAKVTCRRITNECPKIDSCPDGKRPVTIPGQCCKSCQSTNSYNEGGATTPEVPTTTLLPPATERQYGFKNDRVKEYQAIVEAMPACQKRDGADRHQQGLLPNPKASKNNKPNDLNGIDSRLAFKSLDPQNSYMTPVRGRDYNEKPVDDTMRQDHQHPNDVQSGAGGQQGYEIPRTVPFQLPQQTTSTRRPQPTNATPSTTSCTLGSETYQIGDRWNPVLPPHGVQVCVQCNCIVRQRKSACYEAKVTCRRISSECPNIKTCPDGKKPITVAGQCCKSCPNNEQSTGVIPTTTTLPPERIQKNERVLREYQAIMKAHQPCRARDGDKHNSGGNSTTVKRSYRL